MGINRLYRQPADSAKHQQFKLLCLEYFTNHEKLLAKPSRRHAERARKALIRIKKVAHQRGIEILELYAPSMNIGKEPITIPQKQNQPRKKIHNVS
jgi:hypothetical protein